MFSDFCIILLNYKDYASGKPEVSQINAHTYMLTHLILKQ